MSMKAAIFDMDGTLVDSLMLWDVVWKALGTAYRDASFAPTPEDDKAVRTMTTRDAMLFIHDRYGLGKSGEELLSAVNAILKDFYANRVELKPGVAEFLQVCRERGVRMCVASATATNMLQIALEHCGIADCFGRIFSCADLGVGKDVPDVYLAAQAWLGTSTEETWVFEDSLTAVRTAAGIGMPTVGIYDRYNYGQEELQALADVYIAPGETLMKLVEEVGI